jgi:hypothetical protein
LKNIPQEDKCKITKGSFWLYTTFKVVPGQKLSFWTKFVTYGGLSQNFNEPAIGLNVFVLFSLLMNVIKYGKQGG